MPSSLIPDSRERRHLIQEKKPETGQAGRACLEAGRWGEALECLHSAQDTEGLALLQEKALEQGDFFYWNLAIRATGQKPALAELKKIIETSRNRGLEQFAKQAESLLADMDDPT